VDHALVADIFVQPDGPVDLRFGVDVQLFFEHTKSADVCLVGVWISAGVGVHWTKLAIPEWNVVLTRELRFAVELAAQFGVLVFGTGVGILSWNGEAKVRVVVAGVGCVWHDSCEGAEVHCVGVAVYKEYMVRVDLSDGLFHSIVPGDETSMFGVCRFVERVVASDDWIANVVFGDMYPEVDHLILEKSEIPEKCFSDSAVAMPVLVLSTGNSVKVKNNVDVVAAADVYDVVQQLEA
jgi:hypothetical protein